MKFIKALSSVKTINDFFNAFYTCADVVSTVLPYDPEWANGTGYFNGIVHAEFPELKFGEIGRSVVTAPDNRRILIVKTYLGNVAVFERYTPQASGDISGPVVFNGPQDLSNSRSGMLPCEGALRLEDLISILGNGMTRNVGQRLENLMESLVNRDKNNNKEPAGN